MSRTIRLSAKDARRLGIKGGHKFHARRTTVDGIAFDSQAEANRFCELKILQRCNAITDLRRQPRFPLRVDGVLVGTYVGDFAYTENGRYIVEDVKGVQTEVYRLKKKLMLAIHGIEIREV